MAHRNVISAAQVVARAFMPDRLLKYASGVTSKNWVRALANALHSAACIAEAKQPLADGKVCGVSSELVFVRRKKGGTPMKVRRALLAGACLALGATPALHAQEVQMTFAGLACPRASFPDCVNGGQPTPVPYTYSFDVNTASGQFGVVRFGTVNGVSYLAEFQKTGLAVTNVMAVVGGNWVPSPFSSTGGIQLNEESVDSYEFDMQPTTTSGLENGGSEPVFTMVQYRSFQNPLYSILTTSHIGGSTFVGFESVNGLSQWVGVDNTITVTPVPAPGVLALLLPGLAGIWLTRRKRA